MPPIPNTLKKLLIVFLWVVANVAIYRYINNNYQARLTEAILKFQRFIKSTTYGSLIMMLLTCLFSVPPMLGHIIVTSFSGILFDLAEGCHTAVLGTCLGSLLAYLVLRVFQVGRLARKVLPMESEKLDVLLKAVGRGGFKLALMIRLCPIPWQVSSLILSLSTSLSFCEYCAASFLGSFKTCVDVWLGSRLASLWDESLSPAAHKMTVVHMSAGVVLSLVSAYWLYHLTTVKIARETQNVSSEDDREGLIQLDVPNNKGQRDSRFVTIPMLA